MKIVTSHRVIYADTDTMGVVYYANYLRWFEKGRSEFLREVGLPYKAIEAQGFHFPVTAVSCRYWKSAYYDDMLAIETQLTSLGRVSLNFAYAIRREGDNSPLASGATKHACVDVAGRITRIPADVVQHLAPFLVASSTSRER